MISTFRSLQVRTMMNEIDRAYIEWKKAEKHYYMLLREENTQKQNKCIHSWRYLSTDRRGQDGYECRNCGKIKYE